MAASTICSTSVLESQETPKKVRERMPKLNNTNFIAVVV
jgi:hypothetical protein